MISTTTEQVAAGVAATHGRIDADRAASVLAVLDGAGSGDTRFLRRATTVRHGTTALAGASVVVVATTTGLGAIGLLAAAGLRLWADGRTDVADRRLRWLLEAVARCDRSRGVEHTDEILAEADGDILGAVAALHTATRVDVDRMTGNADTVPAA